MRPLFLFAMICSANYVQAKCIRSPQIPCAEVRIQKITANENSSSCAPEVEVRKLSGKKWVKKPIKSVYFESCPTEGASLRGLLKQRSDEEASHPCVYEFVENKSCEASPVQ